MLMPVSKEITSEEWITENIRYPEKYRMIAENESDNDDSSLRAVLCLEHLIKNNFGKKRITIVEVGPIHPDFNDPLMELLSRRRIPPISLLYMRNPHLNCLAIGPVEINEEQKNRLLPGVDYILGLLTTDRHTDNSNELIKRIGEKPDIIYGQHIFETRRKASPLMLPCGRYKPFEKSAEILRDCGFIVVDNYGGEFDQVPLSFEYENISKLKHTHSYMYSNRESIFVFRK